MSSRHLKARALLSPFCLQIACNTDALQVSSSVPASESMISGTNTRLLQLSLVVLVSGGNPSTCLKKGLASWCRRFRIARKRRRPRAVLSCRDRGTGYIRLRRRHFWSAGASEARPRFASLGAEFRHSQSAVVAALCRRTPKVPRVAYPPDSSVSLFALLIPSHPLVSRGRSSAF